MSAASTWWVRPEDLDEDQRSVVALPIEGRYVITGPPGSGKTNLLLLRASHLQLSGHPNTVVLAFNRTLREFMRVGAPNYGIDADKCVTSMAWQINLLRQFGIESHLPAGFSDRRSYLAERLLAAIADGQIGKAYDAILVDEGQDYTKDEMAIVTALTDRLFVVADPNQRIYSTHDAAGGSWSDLVPRRLRYHYRNGRQVCKLADELGKSIAGYIPSLPTSQYDESARPSSVESFLPGSFDAQVDLVLERLTLQRKAYPDEMIGVIAPRMTDVRAFWERLSASEHAPVAVLQTSEDGYVEFTDATRICVSTVHSAKGLEYRALHLINTNRVSGFNNARNLVYTAVTRTKTALSIYSSHGLPGFLDAALSALDPPPDVPELKHLFGGKK